MAEIKANESELSRLEGSLASAGKRLPTSAKFKKGRSRGEGYDEFGRQIRAVERLVKEYRKLLDADVKAVQAAGATLQEADKAAAGALEGGR